MNGKTKAVVIAGLMLVAVASVIYIAPALAYVNGTWDQRHDRDRDSLRDQTCTVSYAAMTLSSMNGTVDQTQDRDRLRLRDGTCAVARAPQII